MLSIFMTVMMISTISCVDHHLCPSELTQLVLKERSLLSQYLADCTPDLFEERPGVEDLEHLFSRARDVQVDLNRILRSEEKISNEMDNDDLVFNLSLVSVAQLFQHWISVKETLSRLLHVLRICNNKMNEMKNNNDNHDDELSSLVSSLPTSYDLKLVYTHLLRVQDVYGLEVKDLVHQADHVGEGLSLHQCFDVVRVAFEMMRKEQFETWSATCLHQLTFPIEREVRTEDIEDMRTRMREVAGVGSDGLRSSQLLESYKHLCQMKSTGSSMASFERCVYRPMNFLESLKLEYLSYDPLVYVVHDVADDKLLKRLRISELERPKGFSSSSGQVMEDDDLSRVGKVGFINTRLESNRDIRHLIHSVTNLDTSQGDPMQVVSYGPGGHYEPHVDFFDVYMNSTRFAMRQMSDRMTTVLFFLNNVAQGGNTVFPYLGLAVRPVMGSVLIFNNLYDDGKGDHYSLHAGCPVLKGAKWIANFWINQRGNELKAKCRLTSDH